jgi:predicted hydrocarbon binding protein
MPVVLYRLMQFTLLDVLGEEFGKEKANDFFRQAGYLAGSEFAKNGLDLTLGFDGFVAHLQEQLKLLTVGILRMERYDAETGEIILTVAEDLDCSGLPITGEAVCVYDEGFLSGVLTTYSGKNYKVIETDCWATGDRVCRFKGTITQ